MHFTSSASPHMVETNYNNIGNLIFNTTRLTGTVKLNLTNGAIGQIFVFDGLYGFRYNIEGPLLCSL